MAIGVGFSQIFTRITAGKLRPPYFNTKLIQWLFNADGIEYNSDTGFFEVIDAKGVRSGTIQEGRCYDFDGSDDYVELPLAEYDLSGRDYWDIEFDVQKDSGDNITLGQSTDTNTRCEVSWYIDDNLYFFTSNGGGSGCRVSLTDFNKHTIRAVYDGSLTGTDRTKLYVDGVEQVTTSLGVSPATLGTFTGTFKVGYNRVGFSNNQIGNIKEYDRNGKLLHFWQCNEAEGDVMRDCVGSINGTIQNADVSEGGTFHVTNNYFENLQNIIGYSEDVPTTQDTLQEGDLINNNYTTFTSNGRFGFSATSDGSSTHVAGTEDEIDLESGERYLVEFNLKLNSGTAPNVRLGFTVGSTNSNIEDCVNGKNSVILTANSTTTGTVFFGNTSTATDYEISNLQIHQLSSENILVPVALNEDGNSTGLDIFGNTPTYTGRVRYNSKVVNNVVGNFDGTIKIQFADLTGITITDYTGTSTPSINGNDIEATAGYLEDITLLNGAILNFTSSAGTKVYDISGNEFHGTTSAGTDLEAFWQPSDDANINSYNILNGFDLWTDGTYFKRVPFDTNGNSIQTDGDVDADGFTWVAKCEAGNWHNNAESKILAPKNPQMFLNDLEMKYWYGEKKTSGYTLVIGEEYIIIQQATLDFTTVGAADNNVGTVFTATAASSILTDDVVKIVSDDTPDPKSFDEIYADAYPDNNFGVVFANIYDYIINDLYKKINILTYENNLTDDEKEVVGKWNKSIIPYPCTDGNFETTEGNYYVKIQ